MNRSIILLIAYSFSLMSSAFGEYERKLKGSDELLAHGESIIYPTFQKKNQKLSYVISDLVELSTVNSPDGIGLSVVPLLDVTKSNPLVSIHEEKKNYFELLDLICIQAGNEYHWSATDDGVVVFRKASTSLTKKPTHPVDGGQ